MTSKSGFSNGHDLNHLGVVVLAHRANLAPNLDWHIVIASHDSKNVHYITLRHGVHCHVWINIVQAYHLSMTKFDISTKCRYALDKSIVCNLRYPTCHIIISILQSLPDNSIYSGPGLGALLSQALFAVKYHLVAVIFLLACLPNRLVKGPTSKQYM